MTVYLLITILTFNQKKNLSKYIYIYFFNIIIKKVIFYFFGTNVLFHFVYKNMGTSDDIKSLKKVFILLKW